MGEKTIAAATMNSKFGHNANTDLRIWGLSTNQDKNINFGVSKTGILYATGAYIKNAHIDAASIEGKLTANQINASDLKVKAANITGTLSASQINASNLKVKAANITGTLSASQINTKNLSVSAANITGNLSVSKLNGTSPAWRSASFIYDIEIKATGTSSNRQIQLRTRAQTFSFLTNAKGSTGSWKTQFSGTI